MKKLILFAILMTAPTAFAATGTLTIGQYASLPDCGGTIKVADSDSENGKSEQLNVSFDNVVNCSNFDIVGLPDYAAVKLQGKAKDRSGSFTIPKRAIKKGLNSIQIVVKSNTGKTKDTVTVNFIEIVTPAPKPAPQPAPKPAKPAEKPAAKANVGGTSYSAMTIGEYGSLKFCGGTIKVDDSANGNSEQLNISFKDVVNCSNFDIVGLSDYAAVKLQGVEKDRSGSFTIPKRAIAAGYNSIKVVVKSDSGKTSDTVNVTFIEIVTPAPAPQPAPAPAPAAPSTGGSSY
ncbi:MAG: hypothetical protein H7222_03420 [Methylotenera sp.]|nr:hypothetical protein [Oligoflexia bacterium]